MSSFDRDTQGYGLSAFWSARQDALSACVLRVEKTLVALATCTPYMSTWYTQPRRGRVPDKPPIDNLERIEELLLKGQNRRDDNRQVITELGYSAMLWNGLSEDGYGSTVRFSCNRTSDYVKNSVVVVFPRVANAAIIDEMKVLDLLISIGQIWVPDWTVVYRTAETSKFDMSQPFLDVALLVTNRHFEARLVSGSTESETAAGRLYVSDKKKGEPVLPDE